MRFLLRAFRLLGAAFLLALVLSFFLVPLPDNDPRPSSPALYDAGGRLYHVRLSADSEWSLPVSLDAMGRWLPLVAVAVEDRRFYAHPGIDPLAVARAVGQNLVSGRVVSGASTITSQLIRLSFSERERKPRSLKTKAQEFIQALKLERRMEKKAILEAYLNQAPFGGNVRGVQAASLIYFGKPAARLSPGEACTLIGMLKGPTLYRPDKRPEAAKKRRDRLIRFLEERGDFTKDEARLALLEELPARWLPLPMRAFHFAEMLLKGSGARPSAHGRVDTTLDLGVQTKLEAILERTVGLFPPRVTAAAGVMDNRTGALVAWVGNARFGTGSPSAWVDCGRSLRSPGSALKPFAYLAAFDKGHLTPSALLADSPLAFSGRAPRNFDLVYRGAVSARVALSHSLNAPAVRVLRLSGPENILQLLRGFGFRDLTEKAAYYGDSLILGGCEVSALQMLSAYAALANGGLHHPVAMTRAEAAQNRATGTRQASAAAAWLVSDTLNNMGRLSAFVRETLGPDWHVAFKTGTSYGLRDAWTAAWTPDFTVVVWVGDPSGTPWPGLVGVQAAAPAALQVLRNTSEKSRWYERPKDVVLREVCALSGRPPTTACVSTRQDWSIEGLTHSLPCNVHVRRDGRSAVLWPSELASDSTPTDAIRKRPDIAITSPIAEATYYLAPLAKGQKIPFRVEGALGKVWWYLNGHYAGTSAPNETFFHTLPDGQHRVSASDGEGRTAATRVTVVSPGRVPRGETSLLQ